MAYCSCLSIEYFINYVFRGSQGTKIRKIKLKIVVLSIDGGKAALQGAINQLFLTVQQPSYPAIRYVINVLKSELITENSVFIKKLCFDIEVQDQPKDQVE